MVLLTKQEVRTFNYEAHKTTMLSFHVRNYVCPKFVLLTYRMFNYSFTIQLFYSLAFKIFINF